MLLGLEVFNKYKEVKEKFPDFDTWVSEAVHAEFGEELRDTLMAAKICKTTRLPWTNPDVFEKIAIVLNGRPVLPGVIQDATMKEITFAVEVLQKEFPDEIFEDLLIKYFMAEAEEEGMVIMPPCLKFVQKFMRPVFLTKEQQHIQNEYLEECKVYSEYLWKTTTTDVLPFSKIKEVK